MDDEIEEIEATETRSTGDANTVQGPAKLTSARRKSSWMDDVEESDKSKLAQTVLQSELDSAAVQQATPSPATIQRPVPDPIEIQKENPQNVILEKLLVENPDVKFAEEIKSPGTSSQGSASSSTRRAPLPDPKTMRQRIHEKLKQQMEEKRGAMYLNKRLQRQRQQDKELVKQSTFASSEEYDSEQLDKQIEHSIKVIAV
ncbi:unnamed protein product [Gongylonema pulchrum]|uniref:Upf2 domain-containing protein n=1 Tax=Gongylonema pulchrum TaxID=637853 RepID=A0A183D728_9BILA|nr:unnamed protein product [Gongylonema pulchrum]